jgi:hypothetical protein
MRFAAQPEPAPAAGGLGGLPPSRRFLALGVVALAVAWPSAGYAEA